MLTTIEGTYENGQVVFNEIPPAVNKSKVLITFVEEIQIPTKAKKRLFGTLKGTINVPADFNEPLDDFKEYM
ncbi:DUF2281 domain-containing protein [Arcicella aquatica]|uniref:DUF2281 domain-containing protein n=1 Tax=Arcicella aquatica TaxID=217141 RepID=A0ABU5QNN4_9BACT|nr:DUF2281 domain-containing protein [Arcicella aquatica]MEA5258036.1 DUF2281 domain-containing protein [Arcicella aquatica]